MSYFQVYSRRSSTDSTQSGQSGSSRRTGHSRVRPGRRSVSPTDYYRNRYIQLERLEQNLFDLRQFVYNGIEKFLDKQAVRDLINDFDHERLHFENDFGRDNLTTPSKILVTTNYKSNMMANGNNTSNNQIRTSSGNRSRKISLNSVGSTGIKRKRQSIMDTFIALVKIKVFNMHRSYGHNSISSKQNQLSNDDYLFGDHESRLNPGSNISCFGL